MSYTSDSIYVQSYLGGRRSARPPGGSKSWFSPYFGGTNCIFEELPLYITAPPGRRDQLRLWLYVHHLQWLNQFCMVWNLIPYRFLFLGPGREAPIVIQHHTTWTYGTYRICSVYNFWCTYTYLVYCHLITYIDNCTILPIRVAILLLGKLTPHLACKKHKIQIDFQIKYLRPTDILASFNIILSTNDVRVQAKTSNWCIDWLKAMLSIVFHNSCL